jgi:hypothetical protein
MGGGWHAGKWTDLRRRKERRDPTTRSERVSAHALAHTPALTKPLCYNSARTTQGLLSAGGYQLAYTLNLSANSARTQS